MPQRGRWVIAIAVLFGVCYALFQAGQLGITVAVLCIVGMVWIVVDRLATDESSGVRSWSNFLRGVGSILAFLAVAVLIAKCSEPDPVCRADPEACQISP